MVEGWAHNPVCMGSIPIPATKQEEAYMEDNVWTGVVDLSPNLQLQYKMGLLINVVENKEIEIPIQHIVCTRSKLEKIFTTATTESLDDFYKIFNNYARAFDILAEVNENFFLAPEYHQ